MWHFDLAPEIELAAAFDAAEILAAEVAGALVSMGAPAPEIAVAITAALTLIGAVTVTLFTGPIPAIAFSLAGVTATPIWCWREIWRSR